MILFLYLPLAYSGSKFSNCLKNSKSRASCLCLIKSKGLVKGNYHDIGAEMNGALINKARQVTFTGGQYNSNPLRPEIHI